MSRTSPDEAYRYVLRLIQTGSLSDTQLAELRTALDARHRPTDRHDPAAWQEVLAALPTRYRRSIEWATGGRRVDTLAQLYDLGRESELLRLRRVENVRFVRGERQWALELRDPDVAAVLLSASGVGPHTVRALWRVLGALGHPLPLGRDDWDLRAAWQQGKRDGLPTGGAA